MARKRNITGTGKDLNKRGEAVSSSPVGNLGDIGGRVASIVKALGKSSKGGKK